MIATGEFEAMPKKEPLLLGRELAKLQKNLSGISAMTRRPDAVFVLDTMKEHIAVTEANKLGIPVVASSTRTSTPMSSSSRSRATTMRSAPTTS